MPNIDKLKEETALSGPQGQKMALNLSPGFLMIDPGETIRDEIGEGKRPDMLAGKIWGVATHGFDLPSEKYPGTRNIRWHGEFGYENRLEQIGQASSVYLPSAVERDLKAAGCPVLVVGSAQEADAMGGPAHPFAAGFSVEIWYERVPRKINAKGYVHGTYNRAGRRHNINALAPPEVRAKLPPEPPTPAHLLGYESDTGEILPPDATSGDARFTLPTVTELVGDGTAPLVEDEPPAAAAE